MKQVIIRHSTPARRTRASEAGGFGVARPNAMGGRGHYLSILLFLLFAMASAYSQTATPPSSGDGSSGDPYQIATLDNLYWLSQNDTAWAAGIYYEQTADIDASASAGWDGGSGFTPIGTNQDRFYGHYDGQGHTITGIYIRRSSSQIGMFGVIGSGGTVDSLGLHGLDITGYENDTGGLAGWVRGGTIRHCFTNGMVRGYAVPGTAGLAGGVVCRMFDGAKLEASYSHAFVAATTVAGGLVSSTNSATDSIIQCFSAGKVIDPGSDAGLLASNAGVVVESYWDTETSGNGSSAGGTGLTTAQMKSSSNFSGWDFVNEWSIDEGSGYPYLWMEATPTTTVFDGGTGTTVDPYLIATLTQLDNVRFYLSNSFRMTTDLDASLTSGWFDGDGLLPTGDSTTPFTGRFDGYGHMITGLTINRSTLNYVGLFGYTETQFIDSIQLVDASIVGGTRVGGILGFGLNTRIRNCSVSGVVTGIGDYVGGIAGQVLVTTARALKSSHSSAMVTGASYVGGLIGVGSGSATHTVNNSTATGTVSGSGEYIGGLAGFADIVENCYATGDVEGGDIVGGLGGWIEYPTDSFSSGRVMGVDQVGGLLGSTPSVVTRCFATGAVSGVEYVGGLIGSNPDPGGGVLVTEIVDSYATGPVRGTSYVGGLTGTHEYGSIATSFATSAVSGTSNVGGLVGYRPLSDPILSDGYWDTQTSGRSSSSGGTGMETSEFQGSLPSGFSSSVWGTGIGLYPYLLWNHATTPESISGVAYDDNGSAHFASDASGAKYVSGFVDGVALDTVAAGANGYYYLLADSGTISPDSSWVLTYSVGSSSGSHIASITGSTSDLDIWGSVLIAATSATTYSSALATSLASLYASGIAAAIGSYPDPTTSLSHDGYVTSGSEFTIDQPLTSSLYIRTTVSEADIIVPDSVSLAGNNGLALLATGDVLFQNDVTISGGGGLFVHSGGDYDLKNGRSISFTGGSGSGASFWVNDTSWNLIYSMAGVQDINASGSSLGESYALATSIDASTVESWTAIGTDGTGTVQNSGNGFSGIFEGLGNSISDLNIEGGDNLYVGLFGYSSGIIRNLDLEDDSISVSNGANYVGGLVGYNTGMLSRCLMSGWIGGQGSQLGGLVGANEGTITESSSGGAIVLGAGGNYRGGLVGATNETSVIGKSYSSVDVTVGSGTEFTGGLVGSSMGIISDCYATGSVTTGTNGDYIGGLVGDSEGSVETSYASGVLSADGSSTVGGLIGWSNSGTTSDSYWSMETSGDSTSAGSETGLTTVQMGDSTSFAGFDFASTWSIDQGYSYPFLRSNLQDPAPGFTGEPLPVQMTGLRAEVRGQMSEVRLQWTTMTEVDNAGWEIERKEMSNVQRSTPNVQRLGSDWKRVGFVEGAGTSTSPREYQFNDDFRVSSGDWKDENPISTPFTIHHSPISSLSYRLKQIDRSGSFSYSREITIDLALIPREFQLHQNFPNPFNPSTTVRFDLKENSAVKLELYDILGRRVIEQEKGIMAAGSYDELMNLSQFATGSYVYRIVAEGISGERFVAVKRMMLVR